MPSTAKSTATAAVAGQEAQRREAKRATFERFMDRKPFEAEFQLALGADPLELDTLLFRSIGSVAYDKLIDDCPPTKEQLANNATYNQDKFMPSLLAKVCVDPLLSVEQWSKIIGSENYGRGEVNELFFSAVGVCNRQLGMAVVNPTGPVSE